MAEKKKIDVLVDLICECAKERLTKRGYKVILQACKTFELSGEETQQAMDAAGYGFAHKKQLADTKTQ